MIRTFYLLLWLSPLLLSAQQQYEWAFTTNQFDKANDFSDGYAIVKKGLVRGFIDRKGQVVIEPQFNIIDAYSENTASAGYVNYQTAESTSGFIDRTGQFTIPPQFEVTSPFQENLACVKQNGKWGFINPRGQFVIPLKFEEANVFANGMAAVKYEGYWGIINTKGDFIIPNKYDYLLGFSEGLCAVMMGDKWGYIDKNGKIAIPIKYETAASFSNGRARVEIDKLFGMIDHSGEFVIQPTFTMLHNFSHGMAVAKKGVSDKWGYIDIDGNFIIPPTFDLAYDFSENLARVKQGSKWGYINLKGKIVIDPIFDVAYDFREGLARVQPLQEEIVIDQPKAKPDEVTVRAIKQGHHIKVKSDSLTIHVYDHKLIDGDIVSLNYNGKWLEKKFLLSEKRHVVKITVDEFLEENYMLFYAENLGRNPPNTATITINDGVGEVQTIVLESDLKTCDIIYFEKEE
jgi:WG containing repeat